MDAVRAFLNEQGSDVQIVLTEKPAELTFTPFKFVISLPRATSSL
jgi:hypothetical protein